MTEVLREAILAAKRWLRNRRWRRRRVASDIRAQKAREDAYKAQVASAARRPPR